MNFAPLLPVRSEPEQDEERRESDLESERLGDTLERVQVEQAVEVTAMNDDERMGGGTGGPTTTEPAAEDGGEGRYGGDGSWPDPTAERRVPRNHPGRAETQSEWESSDEDDELSSDGERGGDEYANEFCEMPADFDEWGGSGLRPGSLWWRGLLLVLAACRVRVGACGCGVCCCANAKSRGRVAVQE